MITIGLSLAGPAHAQLAGPAGEPTESDRAQAREVYERGLEDVAGGRWADALEAFSAAYRLSGVAPALFNAATAMRALGRNVEARDALYRLLAEHDDLDETVRVVAAQMREEVGARIAILELAGIPEGAADLAIRVDAHPVADSGARPLPVEVDPGYRRLAIESRTLGRFAWEGDVAEGARVPLEVELERDDGGIPWWVFAGGAVLVVGLVAIVAVVASGPDEPAHDVQVMLP
jgi:tetratricopeptide (TPR) repeat protein